MILYTVVFQQKAAFYEKLANECGEHVIFEALKKYFNPYGRARRTEYWCIMAIAVLFLFLIITFESFITNEKTVESIYFLNYTIAFYFFKTIAFLLILISVIYFLTFARRCNDIGIAPWCIALILLTLMLFPYINIATVIIVGCIKSDVVKKQDIKNKINKFLFSFRKIVKNYHAK